MNSQPLNLASPTTNVDAQRHHSRTRAARVLFFSGTFIGFTLGYLSAWLLPTIHLMRTATPGAYAPAVATQAAKTVATPASRKSEIPRTSVQAINTAPSPRVILLNPGTAGETLNEPSD